MFCEQNRIYYEPRCHEENYGLAAMFIGARVREQEFTTGRGPDPFSLDTTTGGGGARERPSTGASAWLPLTGPVSEGIKQ